MTTNLHTNRTAVITGATSGIGKEFAYRFAGMGYNLIITGRRENLLNQVSCDIKNTYHVMVETVIVDLAEKSELDILLNLIDNKNDIEVLVNNAGFGFNADYNKNQISSQLKMLNVHVTAPVLLINKVIPQMMANRTGTIINVTSLAAYTPTPDNAMYTSSKSFLTNYSESLSMQIRKYNIRVQCLCPGFTHTDFHKKQGLTSSNFPLGIYSWMEPSEVVKYSLENLDKGKVICIPGATNRFFVHLISIVPRRMYYYFTNHFYKHGKLLKILTGLNHTYGGLLQKMKQKPVNVKVNWL